MSIYGIIFFIVTSLIFLLWYGGKSKPLTESELNAFEHNIKKQHNIDENSDMIKQLRRLCESDDGRPYYMVNLMKFNTEYNEELQMTPQEAHKKYSKGIVKELLKRAGHPALLSKVTGSFIRQSDSQWDEVAIVRYRSRRDMLKMVINLSDPELGKYKWASLKKTDVFPTKLKLNLAFIRVIVITFLFLVSTLF